MSKNKEVRTRIDADYKARILYADLLDLSGGDPNLLVQGLSVALSVIKNDLISLLPKPEPKNAAPTPAPTKSDEPDEEGKGPAPTSEPLTPEPLPERENT